MRMDEGKLPEETRTNLTMLLIAATCTLFLLIGSWLSGAWLVISLPVALAILGLPWRISGSLAMLGVICGGALVSTLMEENAVAGGILVVYPIIALTHFSPKPHRWPLLAAGLVAMLIGSFSGELGSAGRMFVFFTQAMQMDARTAETLVLIIRKGVHVSCYGTLAALVFPVIPRERRHRWLGAALAALAFAAFDEMRQSLTPGRTGSLIDIGWDMLGIALALGAVHLFLWPKQRPSGSGPDF